MKKLTLAQIKKTKPELPDDLTKYLNGDGPKSFESKSLKKQCGCAMHLISLDELKVELLRVGVETTPFEGEQPEDEPGHYEVPVVNLSRGPAKSVLAASYLFMWLPTENRYGAYDQEHECLALFHPDATWTQIVADIEKYVGGGIEKYLCPWPRYPYVKE